MRTVAAFVLRLAYVSAGREGHWALGAFDHARARRAAYACEALRMAADHLEEP